MTTRSESLCPHCGTPVDPLRAGAVSIVGGRIIHFCSPSCRAQHLKRADPSEPRLAPPPPSDTAVDEAPGTAHVIPPLDTEGTGRAADSGAPALHSRAVRPLRPFVAPLAAELALLAAAATAALLLPRSGPGEWFALGATALAIAVSLCWHVWKERRQGMSRIAEAAAVHSGAGLLVAASFTRGGSRYLLACALASLAADPIARIVEVLGRKRSGVLDVLEGRGATPLADEWRDNSSTAARVRRIALTLGWARFAVAAAIGASMLAAHVLSLSEALIATAAALFALNTRALRLATGDAHLAVALAAAKAGAAIRDAHAVERLGGSRITVFEASRTLLERVPKIVDWQVQPDFDPPTTAARLAALEASASGRFAEAIAAFAAPRASQPLPRVSAPESIPGIGIAGVVDGVSAQCGTRRLFIERGISTAQLEPWATKIESTGRRAFFFGIGDRIAATFAIEENPLPGVSEATRRLSLLGLEPAMITSAEVEPARALGTRLGIERVHFETRESDMNGVLEGITAAGDTAILIGSGPCFEESARSATAAIALGATGSTLADVDMKKQGLETAVSLIASARCARRSVRGNLALLMLATGVGLGLSLTWPTPGAAMTASALGAAAGAACTINRPFHWASAVAGRVSRRIVRIAKILRAKIGPILEGR